MKLLVLIRRSLNPLPHVVENFLTPGAMQFTAKFIERGGNDVIMMGAGESRVGRDLQPEMVQQIEVLITQSGQMRPKVVLSRHAVRHSYFHHQARFGIGKPFPGVTRELGLFIRTQLVGKAADDAA